MVLSATSEASMSFEFKSINAAFSLASSLASMAAVAMFSKARALVSAAPISIMGRSFAVDGEHRTSNIERPTSNRGRAELVSEAGV